MKKTLQYTIFLTTHCNLSCRYCFVHLNQKKMSPATFKKIFEYIYGVDRDATREISLMGGEPLLAFNLIKMIPRLTAHWDLRNDDINFAIIPSNGLIMNDGIIDFFSKYKTLRLRFTAHCFQPEVNLKNFNITDSQSKLFPKFLNNVKKYNDQSGRSPRIAYVVTPSNVHRLYDFVKYFAKEGFHDFQLISVGGWVWDQDKLDLYMKNMRSIIKLYQKLKSQNITFKVKPIDTYLEIIKGSESTEVGLFSDAIYFTPSGDAYVSSSPQILKVHQTFKEKELNDRFLIGNIHEGIDLKKRDAFREYLNCKPQYLDCAEHFPVPCDLIRSLVSYGWEKELYSYVKVEQSIFHEIKHLLGDENATLENYAL